VIIGLHAALPTARQRGSIG